MGEFKGMSEKKKNSGTLADIWALLNMDEQINISACTAVCGIFGVICAIFVPINLVAQSTHMAVANAVISLILIINLILILNLSLLSSFSKMKILFFSIF